MAIAVDIADRLYDYTDEECAAGAVEAFQDEHRLSDQEIIAIWSDDSDPRRTQLESLIFKAVDANGTTKRANESIPDGITLALADA